MQVLLIRERVLGLNYKDIIFGLMYRGVVYVDSYWYQWCVDLWMYVYMLRYSKGDFLKQECLFIV